MADTPLPQQLREYAEAYCDNGMLFNDSRLPKVLRSAAEALERQAPVIDAAIAWSGREPSTSVLARAIDRYRYITEPVASRVRST